MIQTQDVVTVKYNGQEKDKKDKVQYHGTFSRPYLSFGPEDELETSQKKLDTIDGEKVYDVTFPKNANSKHAPTDLLMAAIEYLEKKQNEDVAGIKDDAKRAEKEKAKKDPTLILLQYAENGLANEFRMAKYQELKPTVIDFDKAKMKFAEGMVQQGQAKTVTEAFEIMAKFGIK